MLGTVSGDLLLDLLDALAAADGARLLAEVERVAALTPDFGELLRELIVLLHRLALVQQVPGSLAADDPDQARLAALATAMPAEDVQLFYQVALTGQRDLPLAPDPRAGFEMVLLRALAFRPVAAAPADALPAPPAPRAVERSVPRVSDAAPATVPGTGPNAPRRAAAPNPAPPPAVSVESVRLTSHADWQHLVARLPLRGIPSQLAHHCGFLEWADGRLALTLDPTAENLRVASAETRLREALEQALCGPVRLDIQVARPQQETLAQRRVREADERQQLAEETMHADPFAAQLRERFDADWVPGSIAPAD